MLHFYWDTWRSFRSVSLFFFFFLEVSSRFDAATLRHVWIWVWYCFVSVCLCFIWNLWHTALYLLSGWRQIHQQKWDKGTDQAKTRVNGQAGWELKKKKTCIRSHCASNVITGSDTTMWHAALPICQSKIGRVTNGYRCYFPQPPPPPPPPILMSASCAEEEGWPKPGW